MDEEATTEHNWSGDLEDLLRAVEHKDYQDIHVVYCDHNKHNARLSYESCDFVSFYVNDLYI